MDIKAISDSLVANEINLSRGNSASVRVEALAAAGRIAYQMAIVSYDSEFADTMAGLVAKLYSEAQGDVASCESAANAIASDDPAKLEWMTNLEAARRARDEIKNSKEMLERHAADLKVKDGVAEAQKYSVAIQGLIEQMKIANADRCEGLLTSIETMQEMVRSIYRDSLAISNTYSEDTVIAANVGALKVIKDGIDSENGLVNTAKYNYYYRLGHETNNEGL